MDRNKESSPNQQPVREVAVNDGKDAMTEDDLNHGEPKEDEFVWSERDLAELWLSIVNDATIDPEHRRAAYRAALRGEPEWWLVTDWSEEHGDRLVRRDSTLNRPRTRTR
jgi:hypothetical protein